MISGWRLVLAPALACCLSLFTPSSKASQETAPQLTQTGQEAQLVALTNAWTAAINLKDRTKLESLMSPSFVLHAWDESWSVKRTTWMKNLFEKIDLDEYRHSSIVARIYGEIGDVTSKWYWRGTRDGKPFEEHGFALDVWQHNMDGWQVVSRITIIQPGKE